MTDITDDTGGTCSTKPLEPCWPFWGALTSVMGHSGIFYVAPPNDIFGRFQRIASQSLAMLDRRNIDELRVAAHKIQSLIERWIEHDIEQETEIHIEKLTQDGGWELGYLHPDSRRTDDIRYLLANWDFNWDEKPDIPVRSNYSDLVALQGCLGFENRDLNQLDHLGLVKPDKHEFFAVLALMLICEATHSNLKSDHNHQRWKLTNAQIESIGHGTLNAIEAVAYAEQVQLEQKIRTSFAMNQPEILKQELSRRASEQALNAVNTKYIPNNRAKAWVQREWELHQRAYDGNKSEFSRAYAARVKNEFKDAKGEQFSVTDKTIREVWLKNPPIAGK